MAEKDDTKELKMWYAFGFRSPTQSHHLYEGRIEAETIEDAFDFVFRHADNRNRFKRYVGFWVQENMMSRTGDLRVGWITPSRYMSPSYQWRLRKPEDVPLRTEVTANENP